MLALLGSRVIGHPCKVVSSVSRSRVRHSLLATIMSATQHLEAVVCYRKDRMEPAMRFLQQVNNFESSSYHVLF